MEKKFFAIARAIFFIVTSLMLVVGIIFGVNGILKYTTKANEVVSPKTVSFEQFKDSRTPESNATEANATTKQSKESESTTQEVSDLDKSIKESAKTVTNNINGLHFKQQGQELVFNEESIQHIFLYNFKPNLLSIANEVTTKNFFTQIAQESDSLSKHVDYFNTKRISPADYLDWYYTQYVENVKAENERIEQEKQEKIAKQLEAQASFYQAASAFGVFLAATLVLVLFKIEINTRKPEIKNDDKQDNKDGE